MRPIHAVEIEAKSALNRSGMGELYYALNPYLGCLHGCRYCYAADMTSVESPATWGQSVYVRKNIVDVLRREIATKRRGLVGIATITDPYQAVESKYRLTRECLRLLLPNGFRVSIQTKSPLVLRDLDILTGRRNVDAGISLATMDRRIAGLIDPYAPSPAARRNALSKLSASGIDTWMFLGPIIPGLNDDLASIEDLISFAAEHQIRVIYDSLQLYHAARYMLSQDLGTGEMESIKRSLSGDWWERTEAGIKRIARRVGASCNSEAEEPLESTRLVYKQLL